MEFSKDVYVGMLCAGELHRAAEYLSRFPEKSGELAEMVRRMEGGTVRRAEDGWICELDGVYQEYYRDVFWRLTGHAEAEKRLLGRLCALAGADCDSIDGTEELLGRLARCRGFYFLGGRTQGRYGPYIWSEMEPRAFEVELPYGDLDFIVYMMRGFVSRSWLEFISMGESGAGGWQQGTELYCVESCFEGKFGTPEFDVLFLKHEAQHAFDRKMHPGLFSGDVHTEWIPEYRAKIVELMYYPDLSRFRQFLAEASGGDMANTHGYASWRIVRELSRRIMGLEYVSDFEKWEGRLTEVQSAAFECLADSDGELADREL